MMNVQLKHFLQRLRKPSALLSVISQVVSILLLLGFQVDQNVVMAVAAGGCSILVTLGVLSNPDTENKGYGDDLLHCATDGCLEKHVLVGGKMVCKNCGTVYTPVAADGTEKNS